MNDQNDHHRIERLARAIHPDGRLLRAWRLEGGVSAHVTAIEIALPDSRHERLVIRRHGAIDKGHNPNIATDEFRLLNALASAGLAVPAPALVDQDSTFFDTPCLVIEYVDGSTEIAPNDIPPALRQMAGFLTRLHRLNTDRLQLPVLPRREDPVARIRRYLPDSPRGTRIREALNKHGSFFQTNASVLLHGDFWPGNVLWRDGEVAAVLDWEDAAIGDPLADLAGTRLELFWRFGHHAMTDFTSHYTAIIDVDIANLPFWELVVATGAAAHMAEWRLDPDIEAEMRQKTGAFMDRAIEELTTR